MVTAPRPVESFRDAAPYLRRPFAPNAVRWRIVAGQTVVAYVDARTVIERLNLVVPDLWQTRFEPWGGRVETNLLICHLTIDGLTRSDVGKSSTQEPIKGAFSDALKRAAVHFGVGQSLYSMRRISLATDKLEKRGKGWAITPAGETWLRETYAKWLATDRGQHFGEPLDHGDEPDAVGDIDVAEQAEPEQLDLDPALAAKLTEVETRYAALSGTQKRKLPRGRFEAELAAATTLPAAEGLLERVDDLAEGGDS